MLGNFATVHFSGKSIFIGHSSGHNGSKWHSFWVSILWGGWEKERSHTHSHTYGIYSSL